MANLNWEIFPPSKLPRAVQKSQAARTTATASSLPENTVNNSRRTRIWPTVAAKPMRTKASTGVGFMVS